MPRQMTDGEIHRLEVKLATLKRVGDILVEDTTLQTEMLRALAELKEHRRTAVNSR